MAKDSEYSTDGGMGRLRSRLARGVGGSSSRIAGIVFSTWTALSCGGRANEGGTHATTTEVTGGGPSAASGGSGTSASTSGSRASNGGALNTPGPEQSSSGTPSGGGARSTPGAEQSSSGMASGSAGGARTQPAANGSAGGARTQPAANGGAGGTAATTARNSGGNRSSAIETGAAGASNAGSSGMPPRLSQLASRTEWERYRELWDRIDAVEPGSTAYRPYAQTITLEQRDQWIAELATALDAIAGLELLREVEILFLRQITSARIEVMRDGGYHYEMYLHRAPYPFEGQAEESLARLETKIDTLLSLKERCLIDSDVFRSALEQIEREAITFFAFAQLSEEETGRLDLNLELTDLGGPELVAELEQRLLLERTKVADEPNQLAQIEALRARLDSVSGSLDDLALLMQMLEPCR